MADAADADSVQQSGIFSHSNQAGDDNSAMKHIRLLEAGPPGDTLRTPSKQPSDSGNAGTSALLTFVNVSIKNRGRKRRGSTLGSGLSQRKCVVPPADIAAVTNATTSTTKGEEAYAPAGALVHARYGVGVAARPHRGQADHSSLSLNPSWIYATAFRVLFLYGRATGLKATQLQASLLGRLSPIDTLTAVMDSLTLESYSDALRPRLVARYAAAKRLLFSANINSNHWVLLAFDRATSILTI